MGKGTKKPTYKAPPKTIVADKPNFVHVTDTDNQAPTYAIPNSSVNINGQNIATGNFNKTTGTLNTNINQDPQEAILKANQYNLGNAAYTGAQNALAITPEKQQEYVDSIYNPVNNELTRTYTDMNNNWINQNAGSGTLNSLGFQNYRTNQLDRNLGESRSNAMSNAIVQGYDLPNKVLTPFMNAGAMANSGLDSGANRQQALIDTGMQSQAQSASEVAQKFNDKLKALQQENAIRQAYYGADATNSGILNQSNIDNNNNLNAWNLNMYNNQKKPWYASLI